MSPVLAKPLRLTKSRAVGHNAVGVVSISERGRSSITMTRLQKTLITAVIVAGVATPLVVQHQTQVKLREENQSLRHVFD